ncbi:hypothetical protein EDD28_1146 [Salana multivorans]|uniref:Uncharacterized protein n=1 Tax=Salana multivorans TaxID=120377 RepID=A0A3N2D9T3_9MICO|nr:hypothetical protein EDD28_1146 [Salana multivorans]
MPHRYRSDIDSGRTAELPVVVPWTRAPPCRPAAPERPVPRRGHRGAGSGRRPDSVGATAAAPTRPAPGSSTPAPSPPPRRAGALCTSPWPPPPPPRRPTQHRVRRRELRPDTPRRTAAPCASPWPPLRRVRPTSRGRGGHGRRADPPGTGFDRRPGAMVATATAPTPRRRVHPRQLHPPRLPAEPERPVSRHGHRRAGSDRRPGSTVATATAPTLQAPGPTALPAPPWPRRPRGREARPRRALLHVRAPTPSAPGRATRG